MGFLHTSSDVSIQDPHPLASINDDLLEDVSVLALHEIDSLLTLCRIRMPM